MGAPDGPVVRVQAEAFDAQAESAALTAGRKDIGAVVDFIDVTLWPGRHWHTFNVADVALVVGAALVALNGSRERPTTAGCVVP